MFISFGSQWGPPQAPGTHTSLMSGKHLLISYQLSLIRKVCSWMISSLARDQKSMFFKPNANRYVGILHIMKLGNSQILKHVSCSERRERKQIPFERRGLAKWPQVSVLPFVDRIIKRSNCERYCHWQGLCECQRQVVANERQLSPAHLWAEDAFPT